MLRESRFITDLIQEPTWKRVNRMLGEGTCDAWAAVLFLLGLGAVLAFAALAD